MPLTIEQAKTFNMMIERINTRLTPSSDGYLSLTNFYKMKFTPENIYHIYNQGNNKEQLFFLDTQYAHFLSLYKSHIFPHCETICWCLMPNHFHFMIYTDNRCLQKIQQGGLLLDPVTNGFRKTLSSYSHQLNKNSGRSGALFRPKTKSKCLTEDSTNTGNYNNRRSFVQSCFDYIHQNPVEAGLVEDAEQWQWSSSSFYGNKKTDLLCNKEIADRFLG